MGYFKEVNIIEMQMVEESDFEIQSQQQTFESVLCDEVIKPNSSLENLVVLSDFRQSSGHQLQFL